MTRHHYTILLGDDSEDDRLFMRRSLRHLPEISRIAEVQNGEEVISYLTGRGSFADRSLHPAPDLLILDLKMPSKTGHDVLRWLNSKEGGHRRVAVIIVSGSSLPEDIATSLALGASAYHKKSAMKEDQILLVEKVQAALKSLFPSPEEGAALPA
ncbi:MAG TPA: response regulator [Candidatus Methylacidiphilales bacterium]